MKERRDRLWGEHRELSAAINLMELAGNNDALVQNMASCIREAEQELCMKRSQTIKKKSIYFMWQHVKIKLFKSQIVSSCFLFLLILFLPGGLVVLSSLVQPFGSSKLSSHQILMADNALDPHQLGRHSRQGEQRACMSAIWPVVVTGASSAATGSWLGFFRKRSLITQLCSRAMA